MTALLSTPAVAGLTLMEKDFVGNTENASKTGGGDASTASSVAARFAGSTNTIAEGPPPGDGGSDVTGGEFFTTSGTLPVTGATSPNGHTVFQNIPTCADPTGAGLGQSGLPATYRWKIKLERPIVSDLQIQICLDVRKCQEEDDGLGTASTVGIRDFVDGNGWEAPLYMRVFHTGGPLNSAPRTQLPNIVVPGLDRVGPIASFPADLSSTDNPAFFETTILEESISLIGRDCISKWIPNDGQFAALDSVDVEIRVPSSTRVRVRASQDTVAVCYIGTPLPGEQL